MNKPAAQKKPTTVSALFDRAQEDIKAGKLSEAATLYRAVVTHDPKHFSAWMNLGTCLRRMGHLDAAIMVGERALAMKPDHVGCLTNLGNALVDNSDCVRALELQRRAYALDPKDLLVVRNLAVALRENGIFDEAYQHFGSLIAHFPDDGTLPWEQALCLLYQADFTRGWPAFEARWKLPAMTARWPQIARWQVGDTIAGKHILLTEEQGFGDTLLCSRYLPMVIAAVGSNGSVTLACKKPLHRLLSAIKGLTLVTIDDVDQNIKDGAHFDLQAAMMSLPGIFKTDLTNIPPPAALTHDVALPPTVVQSLKAGQGRLKVGIIWSGSVTFANNRKRAVTAERFLPLAGIPGVELYSLQKGPREHDLRAMGGTALIHEIAPHFDDFAETAAALKQLDLVIMTDSAVAHLAGSLGVPVWNLLHDRPYWLYLQERTDSPWYASMTLYRQQTAGDWDGVFARVADDLRVLASRHGKK